jgi:hypothetical protein
MEVAQKISITYTISSEDFFLYENVILLKSFQQKKGYALLPISNKLGNIFNSSIPEKEIGKSRF